MKKQIVVICLLLTGLFASAAGYKAGDEARDFSLKNIDGKMVSLKDFKDAKVDFTGLEFSIGILFNTGKRK